MNEKTNIIKVIELLYQQSPLGKRELSDIEKFLSNPDNINELNSTLRLKLSYLSDLQRNN